MSYVFSLSELASRMLVEAIFYRLDDTQGVPLQYEDYILDITTDLLMQGSNYMLLFRRSVWYFPLRTEIQLNEAYIEMMFHQVISFYWLTFFRSIPLFNCTDSDD